MAPQRSQHHCNYKGCKSMASKSNNGNVCSKHQKTCSNGHPPMIFGDNERCPECKARAQREEKQAKENKKRDQARQEAEKEANAERQREKQARKPRHEKDKDGKNA